MGMEKVFAALDNMEPEQVRHFLETAGGKIKKIKVGMELFYSSGPQFLEEIESRNEVEIFLDLKLHDIPNTVAKSIKSLGGLPIKYLTIHISGGREMIEAALESAKKHLPDTTILGVSYLTSLGENDLMQLWSIEKAQTGAAFERLFQTGMKAGIHGFISSPHELGLISKLESEWNKKVLKVTPGIRFQDEIDSGQIQDQKRVLSPTEALKAGADFLVMGRSLSQADNLLERIEQINSISV